MNKVVRRLVALLAVVVLSLSNTVTVMAQNETESEYVYEVLVRANLRETPSTDGRWIMTVPAGALVFVLEETQADYWYISYEGVKGYIYTGCIVEASEEAAAEAEELQNIDIEAEENSAQEIAENVTGMTAEEVQAYILQRTAEIRMERMARLAEQNATAEESEEDVDSEEEATDNTDTEEDANIDSEEGVNTDSEDTENTNPEGNTTDENTDNMDDEGENITSASTNSLAGIGLSNVGLAPGNLNSAPGNSNSAPVSEPYYIAEAEVLANARLRRYPSADGEKMCTIPQGSIVQVIDDGENGYTHVAFGENEGYIFNRCISYETGEGGRASRNSGVMTTVALEEAAHVQNSEGVSNSAVLNQRRNASALAASSIASQVSVTASAAEVMETMEQSELAQIVEQQELAASNPVGIQITAMETPVRSGSEFEIANRANMRQDPSSESAWMATLPVGAQVTLLGETADGYTMVQYNGMVGYVLDSCVVDRVDITRLGQEPVLFTITAYCSCRICCGNYSPEVTGRESRTATGTIPVEGRTIAVDPAVIPYGTTVHIDGMGDFIAEDCGGMVRENHIDVYFSDHSAAVQFGIQRRYVTIN